MSRGDRDGALRLLRESIAAALDAGHTDAAEALDGFVERLKQR